MACRETIPCPIVELWLMSAQGVSTVEYLRIAGWWIVIIIGTLSATMAVTTTLAIINGGN